MRCNINQIATLMKMNSERKKEKGKRKESTKLKTPPEKDKIVNKTLRLKARNVK